MPKITKAIDIKSPIEKVFKLILDFESYPEFLPEVKSARILKKSSAHIEVEFIVNLIVESNYALKFSPKRPNVISWTMIKGKNMKSNTGSWELSSKGKELTHVIYNVEIEFDWFVPSSVARSLMENSLPKMLENFKSRAEGN